jgi:glycosyltransferase involved in cell wall biosynthesis
MKVALDVSPLKTGHQFRGIGIYTQNLKEAFEKSRISDFNFELVEGRKIPADCDLVHYPFFDLFFLTLPLNKPKPTVVTIHDVIPLVFPQNYPPGLKGSLKFQGQKFSLKGVKAVITDSKNSQKDIFKYLNYPLEKIYVVPLAPASHFKVIKEESLLNNVRKKYNLPNNFVLYVGDVNYNKNILGLIKSFAGLKGETSLVLIGKAFLEKNLPETKEIEKLIKSLKLEKKVFLLGFLPTQDLVAVYNLASVYCQPSFYEGFGLPVLEAMACGCPVVAAKTSSLPEICGQAAILVDPKNINDMIKGLEKAFLEKESLREKGLVQAKKFSWGKTAQKTYEVYQKVV